MERRCNASEGAVMSATATYLTHLECADCGARRDAEREQHRCTCGGILLARYDLERLAREVPREAVGARPWSEGLWRYAPLLPVADPADRVTLGEGATPLLPMPGLSAELGAEVWLKDEGLNPTGSFKARGAAVGVARAEALGAGTLALPTAGNARAALAAYAARAGIPVVVAMPRDAPALDRKSTRLNSSHQIISYAVFCF